MKTSGLILCAMVVVSPAFCADVDTSKLPVPAKNDNLTYEKDIKPIFETSCVRCHGADRQKGGLRLDSLDAVLKGGEDGKVIEIKNSAKSALVIAVAQLDPDTAMPPKRGPSGPSGRGPRGPGGSGGAGFGGGDHPPGPPPGETGGPRPGGRGPGGFFPGGPGGRGPGGPPKPLTSDQVALIRAWIDQGAK